MGIEDHEGNVNDLRRLNIDKLIKANEYTAEHPELHSTTFELPDEVEISAIWTRLEGLGFAAPTSFRYGGNQLLYQHTRTQLTNAPTEVEVVAANEPSDYNGKRISIDDSFISFTNQPYQRNSTTKVELGSDYSNSGSGGADKVVIDESLEIVFHRTVRMPDDKRLHQLPASLGHFPLFNVEEFSERLPPGIVQQGGLFFPMWQREAMWMGFTVENYNQHKRFALRAYVGRINAVSGLPMNEKPPIANEKETKQDYIVIPQQKWIDGICVAPGVVRQFVAMPLGAGYTVEGQKTREERFGGLQLEITPVYRERLKVWFRASDSQPRHFSHAGALHEQTTPSTNGLQVGDKLRVYPQPPTIWVSCKISHVVADLVSSDGQLTASYPEWHIRNTERIFNLGDLGTTKSMRKKGGAISWGPSPPREVSQGSQGPDPTAVLDSTVSSTAFSETNKSQSRTVNVKTADLQSMGLAAGGKLIQDIVKDTNPPHCWNTARSKLLNIHILDPRSCEQVTGVVPKPPPAMDAKACADAGLPFYIMEEDVDNRVEEGNFENVKSVSDMDKHALEEMARGEKEQDEFDPMKPRMCESCEQRLCDCVIRPCNHLFCAICITNSVPPNSKSDTTKVCPRCPTTITHIAGFSAPMNIPGQERLGLKVNVPVRVLEATEDGRVKMKSVYHSRI